MRNLHFSIKKFLVFVFYFCIAGLSVSADSLPENIEFQEEIIMKENVSTFAVKMMSKILNLTKTCKRCSFLQMTDPSDWIWFQKDFDRLFVQIQFPTVPIELKSSSREKIFSSTDDQIVYTLYFEKLYIEKNINECAIDFLSDMQFYLDAQILSTESFIEENGDGFWDITLTMPVLESLGCPFTAFLKARILKEGKCVFVIQTLAFDTSGLINHEHFVNSFSIENKR